MSPSRAVPGLLPRLLALPLAIASLGGCSFVIDSRGQPLPIVGAPLDLSGLPRARAGDLAHAPTIVHGIGPGACCRNLFTGNPAHAPTIVRGADGAPWYYEAPPAGGMSFPSLVRMRAPSAREVQFSEPGQTTTLLRNAVLRLRNHAGTERADVTLHRPGTNSDSDFMLPGHYYLLPTDGQGALVVLWTPAGLKKTEEANVFRVDGSAHHLLPERRFRDRRFSRGGAVFAGAYERPEDGPRAVGIWVLSAETGKEWQIGPLTAPVSWEFDEVHRAILTCTPEGLFRHDWESSSLPALLDPRPCNDMALVQGGRPFESIVYWSSDPPGAALLASRMASFSTEEGPSQPPQPIEQPPGAPVPQGSTLWRALGPFAVAWAPIPDGEPVFYDDPKRVGVYETWVGKTRISERCSYVSFDVTGRRVHWIEVTGYGNYAGDLFSSELPGTRPRLLARNVVAYQQLPDGRIVAAAHQAVTGIHNRVVLIDEERGETRHFADGAIGFHVIDDREIMLRLYRGTESPEVVIVPIPLR